MSAPVLPSAIPDGVLMPIGSHAEITDELIGKVLKAPRWWKPALMLSGLGALGLFWLIGYTVTTGIGVWGNNVPNAWAFAITNFVWWIGIGHAGTFISAVLLLLEQKWRASINRFAEAMTLFAVVQAGLFPLLHLGRPWFFYWLMPYPSTMGLWPQFGSPLAWDVVAVLTYLTVSTLFWYLGLIPDLAAIRDRAPSRLRRRIYGVFALGWTGSAHAWHRWRIGYGLLAGLATPLVVSVHSIVSTDFAVTMLPGWHSTIFPPFFVAGAILSGFAMVITLLVPARRLYSLQRVVTARHFDNIGKMLLVMAWIVTYSYVFEIYCAWRGDDGYEKYTFLFMRPFGPYAAIFWTVIVCNCVIPQALWSRRIRTSSIALWIIALFVQVGMWSERFMLIVSSQSRDFLTSSWRTYAPTWVDLGLLGGTMCFFVFLFLLFLRFIPFVPIMDVKHLAREEGVVHA